uniref:Granzyme II n=1 Tax=Paralichthys olivaceus TaxID=8255 RepID=Q59IT2_PAROL|nr:granzyme II [Paralichthys olivaceus]BAE94914.1 granzyme II [Paralichthys olivaceus]
MFCLRDFTGFFSCMVLLIVHSSHGSEIIDGTEVTPHSLPYMALLQTTEPVCGGILIDPSWVLTAAHCGGIKTVLLGVHSIKADEKNSRQLIKVKKHFAHPCYDPDEMVNDIMLLKLGKRSVKETKTVKCLKLGNVIKDPPAGTSCIVAGWGYTNNKVQKMSDVLMSAKVTVVDRGTCNSRQYYNSKPVITSGMICAGSDGKKNTATCAGDSGGPLMCNGVLAGVTSFGPKICGQNKNPPVFTYLSEKQLSWIKKTMKKSDI